VSQENVDVIRRAFFAVDKGDFEGAVAELSPDFEYVATGAAAGITGTYRGPDGFRRFLKSFWEQFDQPAIEIRRLIDADDEVLSWVTFRDVVPEAARRPAGISGMCGIFVPASRCVDERSRTAMTPSTPRGCRSSA
jgi:ketosteroid isomerase-like protein